MSSGSENARRGPIAGEPPRSGFSSGSLRRSRSRFSSAWTWRPKVGATRETLEAGKASRAKSASETPKATRPRRE